MVKLHACGNCGHYTNVSKLAWLLYRNIEPHCVMKEIISEDRGCKRIEKNSVMCLGGKCEIDR